MEIVGDAIDSYTKDVQEMNDSFQKQNDDDNLFSTQF